MPGALSKPTPIVERKLTLDGREQQFTCDGLLIDHRLIVVRLDHPDPRTAGGHQIPAGSHTLGFFWASRPYNCYRIAGPDHRLIAYRFDIVDRVRLSRGHVQYRDLLLDIWVTPEGRLTIEDADEVIAAERAGLVTLDMSRYIARARHLLERDHVRVRAEIERIAAGLLR